VLSGISNFVRGTCKAALSGGMVGRAMAYKWDLSSQLSFERQRGSRSNQSTTTSSADWQQKRFGAAALHLTEMINHVRKRDSRLATQPAAVSIKKVVYLAHRTSSNSRFGRHETGSAIQRLMSDSCQPVPLVLILS
jgi:hypothetical protein